MKKLFAFLKNRGFTLVEALVATIIAGYCMLPIMGTLQSGIEKTQGFDHKEKLRVLARSRLNKELSVGAFDHTAIDTSTMYHYVYYNNATEPQMLSMDAAVASDVLMATQVPASVSSIVFSYKVSVAVKENLNLGTSTANIKKDFVSGIGGLKAVTVMAELEPNDNVVATDSISLFSLLNIPSFSEDFIWVSNPKNVELIAIDPFARTKAESFLLEPLDDTTKPRDDGANDTARPWNIAVHPNRKFVIIQCKYKIKALNIDRESPKYGKCKEIWPNYELNGSSTTGLSYTSKLADVVKDDKNKAVEDRGIVFRPDGKFCYVAAHDEKKIFSFVASNTENWDNLLLLDKTEFTTTKDKNSVLHAGADGWLYIGPKDANKVIRYPMYHTSIFSQNGQEITDPSNKQVWAIDTLPDGKRFFILWQDNIITRHDSISGEKVGQSVITPTPSGICSDLVLSGDGRYLCIVDAGSGAGKGGFFLLNLSTHGITGTNYTLTDTAVFKKADPNNLGKKEKTEFAMYVPQSNEFVFDEEKKPFLFDVDIPGMLSNSYSSGLPDDRVINFAAVDKSQVAFTARKPSYLLVGLDDKSVNFVDVNTGKVNETMKIPVEAVPVDVALTPRGEKLKVVFGSARTGVDTYDISTRTRTHGPHGAQEMYEVAIPNTYFHADPNQTTFCTLDKHSTDSWRNGYWADVPLPGTPPTDYRMPNDVFSCDWVPQNMVPLTDGGFLYLFKKADGSTCLDWVGRRPWGTYAGSYERFARWYNIKNISLKLPWSISITTASIDGWTGRIELLRHLSFPNGSKVTHIAFDAAVTGKSLTPVIVEIAGGVNTIRDIGNPISVSATGIQTHAITWLNGGVLSANRYPGWWHGSGATTNDGIINYNDSLSGPFTSDYSAPGSTSGSHAEIPSLALGATISDPVFPPGIQRAYKAQFIAEIPGNFPPLNAVNISISPDDRFLAIETIGTPNQVHLYDFATNNFYQETQLNGLVIDYRSNGADVISSVANTCSLSVANPSLASGIKLANSITSRDIWQSHKNWPGNYYYNAGTISTQMEARRDASKRFFGYFVPTSNFSTMAVAHLDPHRLWIGNSQWANTSLLSTSENVSVNDKNAFDCSPSLFFPTLIQLNHMTNGGERLAGLFTMSAAANVAPSQFTGASYDLNRNELTGWDKIASTSTRPFEFKPTWLRTYNLTGCDNDQVSAIVWSRDLGNPLLFHLDTIQDDFWAIKPGNTAPTRFDMGGTFDAADKQLVISDDGQKLIFAKEDTNEVIFIDISNPASFSFNGATRTVSTLSGFGSLARIATMTASPKTLATIPFNHYKSTPHSGSYQQVATLAANISGLQNAALASGGIYILGGSPTIHGPSPGTVTTDGTPTNNIFKFDPTYSYAAGSTITALVATLPRSIHRHAVVAYDNELYVFNGRVLSGSNSSWVQKFNPTTGKVMGSYDPPPSPRRVSPPVMKPPTSVDSANKSAMFGSIKVRWSDQDNNEEAGWKVFDGSFDMTANSSVGGLWSTEPPNPHWVTFDLGTGVTDYADTVKIRSIITSTNDYASIKNFKILGSNIAAPSDSLVGTDWTELFSAAHPDSSTMLTYTLTSPDFYRHYRVHVIDSYSSADLGGLEFEFYDSRILVATEPYLTKTIADNRSEVTSSHNAACMTPYGIIVAGGGTTSALVYWPHGIDDYTASGVPSIGISRSLPPLPANRSYHNLVWHKGRVFRIGGSDAATLNSIDVFDFDYNAWTNVLLTNVASFPVNGVQLKRENAAACSLGDEIFMFGGYDGAALKNDAIAWNPETGNVRLLGTMPMAGNYAKSAVACGSSIYLIGGATNATSGGTAGIWKFTP